MFCHRLKTSNFIMWNLHSNFIHPITIVIHELLFSPKGAQIILLSKISVPARLYFTIIIIRSSNEFKSDIP